MPDANVKAKEWLFVYNNVRCHGAIGYRTPKSAEDVLRAQLLRAQCQVTYYDVERVNGEIREIERAARIRFVRQNQTWAQTARPIAG